MSGTYCYPIDLDGCLNFTPGSDVRPINLHFEGTQIIKLDLSVRIISNTRTRITEEIVRETILPYVNEIWIQAGIEFKIKTIATVQERPNISPLESPEERGFRRRLLTDPSQKLLNVFIVPRTTGRLAYTTFTTTPPNNKYTGESYIIMGEISDGDRINLGRFSNSLAHEIGHALGLSHPREKEQNRKYLMFPLSEHQDDPRHGEEEQLNPFEINMARHHALNVIKPWRFY